ncbi:MAG: ATP-binding cassette domain-containing protein, partial [Bdellovibrionales bacterium]|nr:ATP-binding cassette domain-containing protein [Bdellovibrionales bacterium]
AAEADARAADYLRSVGLSGREKSFPDRLSGGEQQRVALARALVHHPLLVLADEPTGNLDQETGAQCLELLNDLRRKSSSAVLMVTHSLDAAAISDRILRMESGHLLENAPVSL